jgi:predicted RNA polymerase sigma factor
MLERKRGVGARLETEQGSVPDLDAALDDDIGDGILRLIFTACHPLLPERVALTL